MERSRAGGGGRAGARDEEEEAWRKHVRAALGAAGLRAAWVGGWVGGLQAGFGIRGLALCGSLGGCRVALASWHRCKGLESKGVVAPWPRGKPPKTLSGSPLVFP